MPAGTNEAVDNLRYERYVDGSRSPSWTQESWIRQLYYYFRPLFPVALRKRLQRFYLHDWSKLQFPAWPVDRSVDLLLEGLLVSAMQALETDRLPFIWFWPNGRKACAILTHDVETTAGRDFSDRLMDIDASFGFRSSFQIVPEQRYTVPLAFLDSIRERGCEVNVHGFNHEGNLFDNRDKFLKHAERINRYAAEFEAQGFRSPCLYRNIDWFQHLHFSYDMSVPNVARLDPQRGGCCTVMPYFLPGGITELPLTTSQDYTLFHILNDYSTSLWKKQIKIILEGHGLITLLIHPDYVTPSRAQSTYKELLEWIDRIRSDENIWPALAGDVDRWWRQRSAMKLTAVGKDWTIEGPGSDEARLAYACLDQGELIYEIQ